MSTRKLNLERDEAIILVLLVFLGGLRVGLAVATTERWGTKPTVALAMLVLGVLALRRVRG